MLTAITTSAILLHSCYSALFNGTQEVTLRLSKKKERKKPPVRWLDAVYNAKQTGKREQEKCHLKIILPSKAIETQNKKCCFRSKAVCSSSGGGKGLFVLLCSNNVL